MRTGLLLLFAFASGVLFIGARTDDPRMASYSVDPRKDGIELHWKGADGQVLGNIGTLERELTANKRTLLFAMNGGMYTVEQAPLGLYIEEGRTVAGLVTRKDAHGNFYLQPNGVFGVQEDGSAFVCTTDDFARRTGVRYATQSGPMLVVGGAINAVFREGSANLNIRNGVGVRPDGRVVFAISREPVNFHDFAAWFKEQGCTDALYLDGAISKAFIPDQGLRQMDGALGVLIAVDRE